MFDLNSNIRRETMLAPAVVGADTNSASVDLQDFKSCAVDIAIGIGGITFSTVNRIDFVVQHSDDNTNWVAVTNADLIGATVDATGIVRSLVAAHAAPSATRFGYRRTRRYLRVVADFGGTHATGTPIAVVGLLGDPVIAPVAQGA